jgi:peroxiredoxin
VPLMALAVAAMAWPASAAEKSAIGKKIDGFTAKDFHGKEVSLKDYQDQKLVVVAFLGTDCPLAKLYGPRLQALATEFAGKGVAFIGVDSNRQDNVTEIAHYARKHGIEFTLLKDAGNVIADQFGAVRTPEVYLLDKDRVVRYSGRIDDQFGIQENGIMFTRHAPERRDLAVAIDELLQGQLVSQAVSENSGCLIGRIREPKLDSEITYSNQIARIFNNNCVACHREGQIGPFTLTSYEDAAGWAEMIQEVVREQRMPPWHADPNYGHFRNDASLSQEEKDQIYAWVAAGAPEGDPADLPELPPVAEGWQIGEPDEVVKMPEPFMVPADGVVDYQKFVIDPGWTEDRWIRGIECKPGTPAVVHHIIVYLIPPNVTPNGRAGRIQTDWLGAFAPGLRQELLPEGLARYVPAGSKLLMEMHYTPNGTEQPDQSYAGFIFADPSTVKKEVAWQNAGNFTFQIPPNDPNYEVTSEYVFRQNLTLLSISPHMHLRGKDFRYDLITPDGKSETLLWVPKYDFGWQTTYALTNPIEVPRGSKLYCVAHFDNSEDNLNNPDPNRTVGWGEQSFDEMMFGWFEAAPTDQDLTKPIEELATRSKEFLEAAKAGAITIDDQLAMLAKQALKDKKAFEFAGLQIWNLVPQVDRVCVSYVDDDRLLLMNVMQRFGLKTTFSSTSTRLKAKGEPLAEHALGDKPVVHNNLQQAEGPLYEKMAQKGVLSALHVPVEIGGHRCTVNFWSTEVDAFSPEAVEVLTKIAHLIAEGAPSAVVER